MCTSNYYISIHVRQGLGLLKYCLKYRPWDDIKRIFIAMLQLYSFKRHVPFKALPRRRIPMPRVFDNQFTLLMFLHYWE